MATEMRITGIELACDTVESGYRIVALEDGRHALVWGNIRCRIGDRLPEEMIGDRLPEEVVTRSDGAHGVSIHETFEDAVEAYLDIADAFDDMGGAAARTAEEMYAVAEECGVACKPPAWLLDQRDRARARRIDA